MIDVISRHFPSLADCDEGARRRVQAVARQVAADRARLDCEVRPRFPADSYVSVRRGVRLEPDLLVRLKADPA